MDDACGRDNEGNPRYVGELSEVDRTDARIMAKMRGIDPDEARLRLLAQDDRLAFVFGYMAGEAGQAKEDDSQGELAEAYLAGYGLGLRVHAGEITRPEWIGIK